MIRELIITDKDVRGKYRNHEYSQHGEDYSVISAQPIIEFCEKHGIKIASYGGATPLLVFQMVY